jgi:hypothetical protein
MIANEFSELPTFSVDNFVNKLMNQRQTPFESSTKVGLPLLAAPPISTT